MIRLVAVRLLDFGTFIIIVLFLDGDNAILMNTLLGYDWSMTWLVIFGAGRSSC